MTARSYSLRQRLDLVSGVLLIFVAIGGSLALELAHRQQRDAMLVAALHDQERLIDELTAFSEATPLDQPEASASHRRYLEGLGRLERNLRSLQSGGVLDLRDGTQLRVQSLQGRFVEHNLKAALGWFESRAGFLRTASVAAQGDAPTLWREAQQTVRRYGDELQAFVRAMAAAAESRSRSAVLQASKLQLVLMFGGVALFLFGILVVRRLLTMPLHRMADRIDEMQRTGRLVKLPELHHNELGVVAAGFNQLSVQVEEQKHRLRDHIIDLQRVNAELDRLAHLKDDFLATINHQVRTPLTAILEGISLFREGSLGPATEDQQAFLKTMDENARRLAKLIDSVLDLSTLRSGRQVLHREPADLTVLLREAQTLWLAMRSSHSIRLSCEMLPPVYMDRQAVGDVLDQLLRNAFRNSPQDSVVDVEACTRDGMVEVSVRDHGSGIPREDLARIFQPFTHLQTPDAPGAEGSGLGLALCRELIERHRGSIRATSTPDTGTTVTFTLPLATTAFLFAEACRTAQEEAEHEHTQFGLLLTTPAPGLDRAAASRSMQEAEPVLRRHTHRGDQFVKLDDEALAIVAVADPVGLGAMQARLGDIVTQHHLNVRLVPAVFPQDGQTPEELLQAARHRSAAAHATSITKESRHADEKANPHRG